MMIGFLFCKKLTTLIKIQATTEEGQKNNAVLCVYQGRGDIIMKHHTGRGIYPN